MTFALYKLFFARVTKASQVLPVPQVLLENLEWPGQEEKTETLDQQDLP